MLWLKSILSKDSADSSKRAIGVLCIISTIILASIVIFMNKELSGNILTFLLALLGSGTTLLGITLFEKKENESKQ